LFPLLLLQCLALLREVLAAFGQLGQADRAGLVGVQQALVGACGPVQPGAQLLLGGSLPGGAGVGVGDKAVELRQELVGVGKQARDVVPYDRFDLFGADIAAGTSGDPCTQDAVFAVALVDLPHGLPSRRGAGDAIHGQPANLAGEQAAQQIAVPGVVAERERGVARELRLRPVPSALVDQRRHGNGDPLFARLEAAPARAVAWAAGAARLCCRDVSVAVGVGGSGVDWVGQHVMHRGRRPGGAAGPRQVGAGIEAFDDLANGRLLVGEPAIHPAHQFGLLLVDDDAAGHGVTARHVAVAISGAAGDVMAVARLLQLAAAEPLAKHRALILGDGALDLQQELVVGVVGDRVLQEHHLGACATELLE